MDDGAAEAVEFEGREGQLLVGEQDDEDAGNAEDRARGSCADRDAVAGDHVEKEAEQIAGDTRDEVDRDQTGWTKQWFAEQTEVPETPHVGGDVEQADVDEGRREQTPPLASQDKIGV